MTYNKQSDFKEIVDRIDRRDVLKGTLYLGLGSFLTSCSFVGDSNTKQLATRKYEDMFEAISTSTENTVRVPKGYFWDRVVSWGDPLWSDGVSLDDQTGGNAVSQSLAFGDHNDGMAFFTTKDNKKLLAINNESVSLPFICANREDGKPKTKDDAKKIQEAHGVCVIEIKEENNHWSVVKNSKYNRKITPNTKMEITGPLKGYKKLKTSYDDSASIAYGTWNNCGNGRTPWGTYLTCEENFDDYFSSSNENYKISKEFKRYGIGHKSKYGWIKADTRFDISKEPNEPNKCGYIVEIDPMKPNSTPRKLTALGRMKHENVEIVINKKDNKLIAYMGDDERGEYLYKYVSDGTYKEGSIHNTKLLESGTIYVAKFNDHGSGKWLELSPKTTNMSKEEICLHTRIAASSVKATTMDRPEWISAHPNGIDVMCCLTNNKNRGIKPNAGGDLTPIDGPNPRKNNLYGQIIRWVPENANHSHEDFKWQLFAMAGNPTVHTGIKAGSANINQDNMFNSPDGLAYDRGGNLWIQTDGNYSNEGEFAGMGNNQMLVGNPKTGEIKRFLTGPKGCEITGMAWSDDYKSLFVGIQHPEEDISGSFPLGDSHLPRSSVIMIRRKDGDFIV